MNETIKNHAIKITVGSIVVCILFAIGTTWEVAGAMFSLQNNDQAQDKAIVKIGGRLDALASLTLSPQEYSLYEKMIEATNK